MYKTMVDLKKMATFKIEYFYNFNKACRYPQLVEIVFINYFLYYLPLYITLKLVESIPVHKPINGYIKDLSGLEKTSGVFMTIALFILGIVVTHFIGFFYISVYRFAFYIFILSLEIAGFIYVYNENLAITPFMIIIGLSIFACNYSMLEIVYSGIITGLSMHGLITYKTDILYPTNSRNLSRNQIQDQ